MQFALGPGQQIIDNYVEQGNVRFVYRHLPVINEQSVHAAIASECAADQGRFWEYHDLLFEEYARAGRETFQDARLKQLARQIGLDGSEFDACLDSGEHLERLQADVDDGRAAGVEATPTLIIDGNLLRGLQSYEEYQQAIEAALAEAR